MGDIQHFNFILGSGSIIHAWIEVIGRNNVLPRVAHAPHARADTPVVLMHPIGRLPSQVGQGRTALQAFIQAWQNALALASRADEQIVEVEADNFDLVPVASMRGVITPGLAITRI